MHPLRPLERNSFLIQRQRPVQLRSDDRSSRRDVADDGLIARSRTQWKLRIADGSGMIPIERLKRHLFRLPITYRCEMGASILASNRIFRS